MTHNKRPLYGVMVKSYSRRPRTIRIGRLLAVLAIVIAVLALAILWAGGAI